MGRVEKNKQNERKTLQTLSCKNGNQDVELQLDGRRNKGLNMLLYIIKVIDKLTKN